MKIVVASGKGGTGKTFVATNLYETSRNTGHATILADCDAEVPNASHFIRAEKTSQENVTEYRPEFDAQKCTFCGKCMEYCTYNAIFCIPAQSQIRLLTHLCHGCGACAVACEEHAVKDGAAAVGVITFYKKDEQTVFIEGKMKSGEISAVPVIKQTIKRASEVPADYLIIDAPPGTSCPFIQTVARADYAVLVTEPTPFGLSDLRQAVETLRTLKKPFGVVINRAGLGNKEMYGYLKRERIELLAEIPFDKEIARIYSTGGLVVSTDKKMEQLFKTLMERIGENGNSCS
ncbi:MAG: ATP-binding protein [Bacteroides sp.]|jgi:MinD superfamily P-loop ATPase|nr:ATP-binding protein [Bacteroides sp.]